MDIKSYPNNFIIKQGLNTNANRISFSEQKPIETLLLHNQMHVNTDSKLGTIIRFRFIDRTCSRGSAPVNENDIRLLAEKGITKILCLRTFNGYDSSNTMSLTKEKDLCKKYNIEFVHIPIHFVFAKNGKTIGNFFGSQIDRVFANHSERYEELWNRIKPHFEALANTNNSNDKIFLHCRKGLDRSGIVAGMYLAWKKIDTPERILEGYLNNLSNSPEIRIFPKSYLKTLKKIYSGEI